MLLANHGYAVLFAYVLLSQLGLPLPSAPLLIAAGALSATGRLHAGVAMAVATAASLCADSAWYALGRARGAVILRTLCRISIEPEVCVRRTKDSFGRYGAAFLLGAKFLPGVGLMAAPVAGQVRMSYVRFLGFNAAGALAWSAAYGSLGFLFGEWVERSARLLTAAARFGLPATAVVLLALIALRLQRRRRFQARTAMERISPQELKKRMDRGDLLYIVDLRSDSPEHDSLPGAVSLAPQAAIAQATVMPMDRDIVLLCDCPGEATAALVARTLREEGVTRVHPLAGGLEGWKLAGYPLARLG
jgi:membrane protein DedA with SNARE-associated domain/rhodanese-related sulfurtransferase